MKRESWQNFSGSRLAEKAWTVNAMVVYEDLPTGLRAQSSLDDLQNLWHPQPIFSDALWHFNLFRDPLFREQAVQDACDADLIILSAHGKAALPPELVDWLERWTGKKEGRQYIIYLLLDQDQETAAGSPVGNYLTRVANKAEADLCTSARKLKLLGLRWHDETAFNTSFRQAQLVAGNLNKPSFENRTLKYSPSNLTENLTR